MKNLKSYYEKDADFRKNEKSHSDIHIRFKYFIWPMIRNLPKYYRILDAGTGSGYMVNEIRKRGFVTIGSDLSSKMIKIAKKDYGNYFVTDDIMKSRFKDNQFDVVIFSETLEHIPDLNRAMKELRRVASKYILITVPYKEKVVMEVCPHCLKKYHKSGHIHYFDNAKIDIIVRKHKLKIVKMKKLMHMPYVKLGYPLGRVANKAIDILDLSTGVVILFEVKK
ncbi:MAG: class I SAM-dependent methyltransferase [Nanoarchaeota archaeon]|nr:class I SAM-dependent methyltransferase [Nanoarchaeota archaeon]